jgi:hypothetical protein
LPETDRIESLFFKVLEDIKDYLLDLTLVGGWMPYVYSRFLWNNLAVKAVTTADIDFGFGTHQSKVYPKTIFSVLSSLDYIERHPKIDRMYPVVLYKEGKVPVEFITFPEVEEKIVETLVGIQMTISKIAHFDFLLNHRISIDVVDKNKKASYKVNCPTPSAFLYHKAATFIFRETEQRQAKDLYYMYFILRYAPDLDVIFKEISKYKKQGNLNDISKNLDEFFAGKSGSGCLMVEKENGPDEYIADLRQDIFERFSQLQKVIKDI